MRGKQEEGEVMLWSRQGTLRDGESGVSSAAVRRGEGEGRRRRRRRGRSRMGLGAAGASPGTAAGFAAGEEHDLT